MRPRALRGANSLIYIGAVDWVRPETKARMNLASAKTFQFGATNSITTPTIMTATLKKMTARRPNLSAIGPIKN